jgi:hypothetical protein
MADWLDAFAVRRRTDQLAGGVTAWKKARRTKGIQPEGQDSVSGQGQNT